MSTNGASRQVYRGVWAVMARFFKVPEEPPTLKALAGEQVRSFRPSPGFLSYLKFWFWIGLPAMDVALAVAWFAILLDRPITALVLAPLFVVAMVAPDILAYVALHLRYDTTWYVMTDRSLRIRRGIWLLRETTVTFENVQNVELRQGPLQRHFGIADLVVQTAGGGSVHPKKGQTNPHESILEGLADARPIRDAIMSRVRRSRRAGLGDEHPDDHRRPAAGAAWTPAHLAALREIRDEVVALGAR